MRQIRVLQWEEIKTKNSASVGALGLFTFLPQCTVHNLRISVLGVPEYSSLAKLDFAIHSVEKETKCIIVSV